MNAHHHAGDEVLRLERETEEVSPHTVPHNCIHFLAAATNAQKIRVLQHQGLEILGNYYPKWSRAVCLKDGLERAWCEGSSWRAAFRLRCTVCCDVVKHEPATAQQTELNRETPSASSCGAAAREPPRRRTFFFSLGRENVQLIDNHSKNPLPDPPGCHFARYKYN